MVTNRPSKHINTQIIIVVTGKGNQVFGLKLMHLNNQIISNYYQTKTIVPTSHPLPPDSSGCLLPLNSFPIARSDCFFHLVLADAFVSVSIASEANTHTAYFLLSRHFEVVVRLFCKVDNSV